MNMTDKIKLKKTLYIGLGGTGVSAILKTKQCFIDSYGEVPPMIGFLAIDTDKSALSESVVSRKGQTVKLAHSELLVCTVQQPLQMYQNNPLQFDWLPQLNVKTLNSISGNGAGQIRSNGRYIVRYNEVQIASKITAAINSISATIPLNSKYVVDVDDNGVSHPTAVNVACSVAGGSGSGMIVDVLCIIDKALKQVGQNFYIYPWIVLPEIFKAMNSGPSMHNVLYNSFGALKELDYMMHLTPDQVPLNFGYTMISQSPAKFAFLLNNTNTAGNVFTKIDDITDILGKSMFLPSNAMGDKILSPFDNILTFRTAGTYDILNKSAWAASAGSAELIYDNQEVGQALNCRISMYLCGLLQAFSEDGNQVANSFVDDPKVLIRENEGKDDVIDSLLDPNAIFSLRLDANTTKADVLNYISENTGKKITDKIQGNYNSKLFEVSKAFNDTIAIEMNKPNALSSALQFISSLKKIIEICKSEMENEKNDLVNSFYDIDWEQQLSSFKNTGLNAFIRPIDKDQLEVVEQTLVDYIIGRREELRRDWALKFYNTFSNEIIQMENELIKLKNILKNISDDSLSKLTALQHRASSKSKFVIYLHEEDVKNAAIDKQTDYALNFVHSMQGKGGVISLLGLTKDQVAEKIDQFTRNTSTFKNAVNVTIEDKLREMDPEVVSMYLKNILNSAAPLWTHDTRGYITKQFELDQFIIVGVNNSGNSIVQSKYSDLFDINGNHAKFATTHQSDRIVVMRVENLLPVYAVNNLQAYKREPERSIANYLDEKWKNRMDRENFRVNPTPQKNNVLELWVYGFIFGYLKFNEDNREYYTFSKKLGNPIKKYYYSLGSLRDDAFETFKNQGVYKEVEDRLNEEIRQNGVPYFDEKINIVKQSGEYLRDFSCVNKSELDQIDQPNFVSIKRLLEQEIDFISK